MEIKSLIAISIITLPILAYSNQQAVTSDGKVVILFDNKTWKFQSDSDEVKISTNKKAYNKSPDATFKVECLGTNFEAWINPKLWQFNASKEDGEKRLKFNHRNFDLFGIVIAEQTEISIEAFKDIALGNARSYSPDAELKKAEYRTVNSNKVLYLEFSGTASGVKFNYYGYYSSNKTGSVQFLTYCGSAICEGKNEVIETFLNGLMTKEFDRPAK